MSTDNTYSGTGSQTDFTITFPYLSRDFVEVRVDSVLTNSYSFISDSVIRFSPAPAAGVSNIVISRNTSFTPLVDFVNGSALVESDLDKGTRQGLNAVEERFTVVDEMGPRLDDMEIRVDALVSGETVEGVTARTVLLENKDVVIEADIVALEADIVDLQATGFNVKSYGATGDGTTDDTVAIQAAVDASPTNTAYAPAGSYLVSEDIEGVLTTDSLVSVVGTGSITVTNTSHLPHADETQFVEALRGFKPLTVQMSVPQNADRVEVMCPYADGTYIMYEYRPDPTLVSPYVQQGFVYTGDWVSGSSTAGGQYETSGVFAGTWTGASQNDSYGWTEVVGSTWTSTITVSGEYSGVLSFNHYSDERGGDMDVEVRANDAAGAVLATLTVSTYVPEADTGKKKSTILEDVTPGDYWVQLTTAGTTAERKWMGQLDDLILSYGSPAYLASTVEYITPPSNKDFAIQVAPVEAPTDFEFVPTHSGINTETNIIDPVWYADGAVFDYSVAGAVIHCSQSTLAQEISFSNPAATPARALGIIHTLQEVNEYGELVMSGFMSPNEPIVLGNGYTIMHPIRIENSDYIITGLGRKFALDDPSTVDSIPLSAESDTTLNYAYVGKSLGSTSVDLIGAVKVENPQVTRQVGGPGKRSPHLRTYLSRTSTTRDKLYTFLFEKPHYSDQVISWSGRYKYVKSPLIAKLVPTLVK